MKISKYVFVLVLFILSNCEEKENPTPASTDIFWIYSYFWPCDPFNDNWEPCYAIQRGQQFDYSKIIDQSETVLPKINNFQFEEGNLYQVEVSEKPGNPTELSLVRIIEKKKDYLNELLGNWQIIEVFEISYPNEDFPEYDGFSIYGTPRAISGTNGCTGDTAIFGEIGQNKLEILVPIEFSDGLCEKEIPSGQALNQSVKYQISNGILSLFDINNATLMKLKKS